MPGLLIVALVATLIAFGWGCIIGYIIRGMRP